MKKVIKAKLYNTETAVRVGAWDNGRYTNDFEYCSEDLYRKKSGEFFLHGEGGALSLYASRCGDGTGYGETIIPMTYSEAQAWAEKRLIGEEYEAIFGEVQEDDNTVKICISMTAAEAEIIKRRAAQDGMTVSQYIVRNCAE